MDTVEPIEVHAPAPVPVVEPVKHGVVVALGAVGGELAGAVVGVVPGALIGSTVSCEGHGIECRTIQQGMFSGAAVGAGVGAVLGAGVTARLRHRSATGPMVGASLAGAAGGLAALAGALGSDGPLAGWGIVAVVAGAPVLAGLGGAASEEDRREVAWMPMRDGEAWGLRLAGSF